MRTSDERGASLIKTPVRTLRRMCVKKKAVAMEQRDDYVKSSQACARKGEGRYRRPAATACLRRTRRRPCRRRLRTL